MHTHMQTDIPSEAQSGSSYPLVHSSVHFSSLVWKSFHIAPSDSEEHATG